MTLIIMLILAGISLSGLIGEKGLFQRTEKVSNRYSEAKARETLETVLLTDGQFEKNTNPKYNEEEFLNKLIKDEIPGADVRGDVAIIGGEYAYDLDRSVPKIGTRGNNGYLGNPKDLVWPDVSATVKLADDKKNATITIKASEEKQGINKIEIWLLGEKIAEEPYDNVKTEITLPYIATQNGKYTIKAYGNLMEKTTVTVDGIVASVKFEPNGDETWKKSHSTTVTIQETADKVVNSKYYWSNSVTTPDNSKFLEDQTFKSGDTITKNGDTGTYYLWTRLETQSGEVLKWRSEGFNFDNTGPTATLTPTPVSYSSFKLNLTTQDNESGIATYEIFVKGVSQGKTTVDGKSATKELTINNATYGETSCYVIVIDKVGNTTRQDITAKTLMDTTGPNITEFTADKSSESAITLSATANDIGGTGVVKFVFSIGSVTKEVTCSATTSNITKSVTITGLATGSGKTCKVVVYDAKDNSNTKTTIGSTKLYVWTRRYITSFEGYFMYKQTADTCSMVERDYDEWWTSGNAVVYKTLPNVNKNTGEFTGGTKFQGRFTELKKGWYFEAMVGNLRRLYTFCSDVTLWNSGPNYCIHYTYAYQVGYNERTYGSTSTISVTQKNAYQEGQIVGNYEYISCTIQ